jgi:hypothetical protein
VLVLIEVLGIIFGYSTKTATTKTTITTAMIGNALFIKFKKVMYI